MEKGDILILGAIGLIAFWGMRKTTAQQPTVTQPTIQQSIQPSPYTRLFSTSNIQQQAELLAQITELQKQMPPSVPYVSPETIQTYQQIDQQILPYIQSSQRKYLNTYIEQLQQQQQQYALNQIQQQAITQQIQQLQQQLIALQPRTASGLPLPQPYKLPV